MQKRRVGVVVISPGPQPGEREFKSRTRHGKSWPHRLWVRSRPFKSRNRVRLPVGLPRNPEQGFWPISRSLMAGQRTVNPRCGGSNPPARALCLMQKFASGKNPLRLLPALPAPCWLLYARITLLGRVAQRKSPTPSRWYVPVQIRSRSPGPHSSAAEHRDDNPGRHVRLVLRVPRSCGEKEIIPDYESGGGGSNPSGSAFKLG